jgi:N6-adenosine-specific RNA methylase IME4
MELEKYRGFKAELAIAETFEEIRLLESKAAAVAEFAKKDGIGLNEQNEWGKFRVEITDKKGAWLEKRFPTLHGKQIIGLNNTTLKTVDITKNESSNARLIHNKPDLKEKVINDIIANGRVVTPNAVSSGIRKEEKETEIETTKQKIEIENSIITDKYDVIVIDPPWPYGRKYDPKNSRVASPYPELSLEEISKIELPLKEDAVIFLWTTHAFIRDAFKLVDLWGLNYKAIITWDKEKMGMGNTIRMQCEFCLLCTKGKPLITGTSERDIIREARREHSRKPEAFYLMVERLTTGKRLDYFARQSRENWDVYGAETEKF